MLRYNAEPRPSWPGPNPRARSVVSMRQSWEPGSCYSCGDSTFDDFCESCLEWSKQDHQSPWDDLGVGD